MQGNSCIVLVILGLSGLNFTALQQNEHTYELRKCTQNICWISINEFKLLLNLKYEMKTEWNFCCVKDTAV